MLRAIYRTVLRPILFLLPAEAAHHVAAFGLELAQRSRILRWLIAAPTPDAALEVRALGRTFASPVCVAAGFDKDARMYNALGALGFAAVEVGTITAAAQPGNPRPRLFRLKADRAVVNRMGFNNGGADAAARSIRARPPQGVVLGINIGKTKVVPVEQAAADYALSARALGDLADYVVVNVSSPNTPGLRSLQSVEALRPVLAAVQRELARFAAPPPLLVKIAPDLSDEDIDAVADLALEMSLAGIVATNTTIARDSLSLRTPAAEVAAVGAGGLSGAPLRTRALDVVRRLAARSRGRLLLIGVGGITTADDAWEMLRAGASLVQVYSAFIYEGPTLARDLNAGLRARLRAEGIARVADLTAQGGRDAPHGAGHSER